MSRAVFLLLLCPLLWAVHPIAAPAQSRPFEESEKQHSWFSFNRPSKSNPADQLAWARSLRDDGRLRKATRAFRALVTTWPGSPEAPSAQLELAQTLDVRGKLEDAFEEYDGLTRRFTGGYAYDEVLRRQFEIARAILDKRRGGLLIFGGFRAPERAIPLLEKVVQNGPRSPYAPEAQFLIAQAYEWSDQLELAVVAYMTAQHRYPTGPWAEKSSFGRARMLVRLSEENPNDEETLEQAWAAVAVFLNTYPKSDDAPVAQAYRETLLRRRAKAAYDKALFYDRLAKRPAAAHQAYSTFLRQFPNSEWTAVARARMEELSPFVEKTNEN